MSLQFPRSFTRETSHVITDFAASDEILQSVVLRMHRFKRIIKSETKKRFSKIKNRELPC